MSDKLSQRLAAVQARIVQACTDYGRDPAQVQLLAVSKTHPAAAVAEVAALGQRAFGENYVQELHDKALALADLALEWHFIGPLQSNKTRVVAEHCAWVHSVDRLRVAQRLSDQRPDHLAALNICIQVNISAQDSKSGVTLEQAESLLLEVAQLPRLRVRGLMAIPAPATTLEQQRQPCAALRSLLQQLQQKHLQLELDTLSMGMSDDLEAAIAEGSTMVRIGTAIFGARGTVPL